MTNIVTRTFGLDFIYFDLVFIALWTILMIHRKYYAPMFWGLVGWIIYIMVDYILWYRVMGSRHYTGPLNPLVFFAWFCFSPGFVQVSYVTIMFEKRSVKEIVSWTLLLYCGWTMVGILSQQLHMDDTVIRISRDMGIGSQRWIMGGLAVLNFLIGVILVMMKRLSWQNMFYLFLVGTLVEFALEVSLLASGIRLEQGHWSLGMMVVNGLIEFNCGIVITWLLWKYLTPRQCYLTIGRSKV